MRRKRSKIAGPIFFGPHRWPIHSDAEGNLHIHVSESEHVICAAANADWLIRQVSAEPTP